MKRRISGVLGALLLCGALLVVTAGLASAAVPGLQRTAVPVTSFSISPTSAEASCPPGKRVIGTGARISGGQGEVIITGIIPNATLTSVTVTGHEDANGFSGNWTVTAIAICADPLPGLVRAVGIQGPNRDSPKLLNVQCPDGKKAIGTGAATSGALGRARLESMIAGADDSSARAFQQQGDTIGEWSLTTYAICANSALPGQELTSDGGDGFNSEPKDATVGCGAKKVVSTGFSLVQGSGQAVLTDIVPNAALTSVRVAAVEDQDGHPGVWSIRSFAFCVNP